MGIIRIKNAVFYAYHGALEEEQSIGGKYECDVEIETDFSEAVNKDNLKLTINYYNVYKFISRIVQEKKYYLIETLTNVIADELLQNFNQIISIKVCLRKRSVPIGGVIDYVEVEVNKKNEK
ncbi:MAG: dihydroneopterin aldolase [Ignavibacteriales bacterium CG_4_9_14_3_um_filter_34_10]|nr:MAG: dihydroneopterin aldolase [Ignavibacteriales bacterium CG_4_9_14_3_um_filter_34_10]